MNKLKKKGNWHMEIGVEIGYLIIFLNLYHFQMFISSIDVNMTSIIR